MACCLLLVSVVIWFTDSSHLSFSVVSRFSRSLITNTVAVTGILVNRAVTSKDNIFLPSGTSNSHVTHPQFQSAEEDRGMRSKYSDRIPSFLRRNYV